VSIQRYDYDPKTEGALIPLEDGDWVSYDDHAVEIARRDAEIERLRAALESIVLPTEAAKNYIDYGIGYAHTIGELISACRKAYDAVMRSEAQQ
jgi:hypothetical protein